MRTLPRGSTLLPVVALSVAPLSAGPSASDPITPSSSTAIQAVAYGNLPIRFEQNRGQTSREVEFLSRGNGYTLFLTRREAVLTLAAVEASKPARAGEVPDGITDRAQPVAKHAVVRMRFVGARATPLAGIEEMPGRANYFIGSDPNRWVRDVPHYEHVRQRAIYPGIDAVFHGRAGTLEYDLAVAPGADPRDVEIRFDGADDLRIESDGSLVLATNVGELRLRAPHTYQDMESGRREIPSRYVRTAPDRVAFDVDAYDRDSPLVIDPVLDYATYLGGSNFERAFGIAVDGSGNAYITGLTTSADFPTANPRQPSLAGTYDRFVSKLNASGTALVYSTYLGGTGSDFGLRGGIAVDALGNAWITGQTSSTDFPTTPGAIKTTLAGFSDTGDGFVTKLNSTGSTLLYSTYLGGGQDDEGLDLTLDASGNPYVVGHTYSPDFPTLNAAQPIIGGDRDAFVTKLGAAGGLVYSTFIGGSFFEWGLGIAVDPAGGAYLVGSTGSTNFPVTAGVFQPGFMGYADAFVARLSASGSSVVFATYLGGSGDDYAIGVTVDASGNAYVVGGTESANFPTVNAYDPTKSSDGRPDGFLSKVSPNGAGLLVSTYFGGGETGVSPQGYGCFGQDVVRSVILDGSGNICLQGYTSSCDFPTSSPTQCSNASQYNDAFVSIFDPTASSLLFSTYLGGSGNEGEFGYHPAFGGGDLAVDALGNLYVVGYTESTDFPTVNPLQPSPGGGGADVFVAKWNRAGGGPNIANLVLDQTDSSDPVTVNSTLTYTVTVRNLGPSCAGNVVVRDRIPPTTFLQFFQAFRGTCIDSSGTLVCTFGTISPNDTAAFYTVTVFTTALGVIENVASGSTSTPDSDPSDNTSTEQTTVQEVQVADLYVRQSAFPEPVSVGSPITFTIDVGNLGPNTAQSVSLSHMLYGMPRSIVSITSTRGTCTSSDTLGPYYGCSLGDFAPGDSARVVVVAIPEAEGLLSSDVNVGSFTNDYNYGNNYDYRTFTVLPSPQQLIDDLIAYIEGLGLNKGQEKKLVKSLQDVRAAASSGNLDAACLELQGFRRRVAVQAGRALTVAQAGELDRRADEIQAVLTCAPQFRIVAVDATTDTPFGFRLVSRGPGGIRTALAMPAAGRARVAVFDVGGRLVGTAFDGSLSAGSHEIVWDARGSDGVLAPSGVYFLRATAGPNAAVARVVLMH